MDIYIYMYESEDMLKRFPNCERGIVETSQATEVVSAALPSQAENCSRLLI